MPIGDSNHKGNVAELKILAAAADLGLEVSKPMTEHCRYDLIFDVRYRLFRVQCKWAKLRGDVIAVQIGGNYHSPTRGYVRSTYDETEIDAVVAYCAGNDTCYFIPIAEIAGISGIHLRLAPARNGQLAGVRMAAPYELGAVDQLVDRFTGSEEAVGSNPSSSTLSAGPNHIGSEEFRRRLGLITHRAAAGETFHITRRGKPFCRLTPPESLLDDGGEIAQSNPSSEHE